MRCGSKSPEASQRVAASSDPETAAAGLVAAATMSEGCGVSLRGGPAICQRSRRALWDRRREGPAAGQGRGIKIAIGTSAIVPILALYSGNSGADSGKLKF